MCSPLRKWVQSANFYLYLTHFLSAWGDRMWAFGVGLFLVNIASHDLQLPAIYGLSSSITIFFLGALIGDWVDSTSRLKAAVLSLFLQNVFVVICAGGVYAFLFFDGEIRSGERSEWLLPLCQGGIILLAILSMLASLARHIAVERDWVVQICGKDKDRLATMTSSLRRIDQVTLILAPIATGQVMTFAGLRNGAVFIAGWNVFSLFVEYALLLKVYKTVPALSGKKGQSQPPQPPAEQEEPGVTEQNLKGQDEEEGETANVALTSVSVTDGDSEKVMTVPDGTNVDTETGDVASNVDADAAQAVGDSKKEQTDKEEPAAAAMAAKKKAKCERVLSRVLVLYRGWRTYMRYSVALAGIALACLYMTVLGFDNITVAYATTQGMSESVLGILMGASAVFGILGTFGYPALRHRVGSVRTGIFALSAQVSCLTLCLVSIWMPGSPFDPLYYMRPPPKIPVCSNATSMAMDVQTNSSSSTGVYVIDVSTSAQPLLGGSNASNVSDCTVVPKSGPDSYLSVALLMAGIVLSRFGLWVADLTITQLFLEEVQEKERGIVSGVQSSLNQIMSVLKFVLVVAFPDVATFGYLIILSFCFICLGWVFYAVFIRRTRGHFFHFEKCKCGNGYNVPQTVTVHEPPPPPPPKAQPQQAETAT